MAEISNKFLVFLLVIVIIVTVIGTWYSVDKINKYSLLTGYGTQGNVSVTISGQVEINVTQPYCTFGSGYVTAPYEYAILHPGTTSCGFDEDTKDNWTNETSYDPDCMEVRNDGNVNAIINVSSGDGSATNFIGGTSPEYKVWSEDKDPNACMSGTIGLPGTEFANQNITICSSLGYSDAQDELYAGCYLKIPGDAYGSKTDSWTFTATQT